MCAYCASHFIQENTVLFEAFELCASTGARVPPYITEKCTLQYLLTWCLEIRSIPKKVMYTLCKMVSDTKQHTVH